MDCGCKTCTMTTATLQLCKGCCDYTDDTPCSAILQYF